MQALVRASIIAAALAASAGTQASAQTPEQFYDGKTIDFVIGYPPGGSNDTLGRLVARHIGKHIPGKPNVVPKNQPGAGSFLAVNQHLQRLAQGRQRDRHRRTDHGARREARHPGRALQDRRTELGGAHRLPDQHGVHVEDLAGEERGRRAEDRIHAVRHRGRLDRLDLSHRHEQRVRHQVQAGDGIQGLERSDARGRARRGRRPLHLLDGAEGRPPGLDPGQERHGVRAVRPQAARRASGRSDRRRSRPQRRGAGDPLARS